jgi:carbohydrate diacid regulator
MKLEQGLAETIVARTMPIIGNNINVMDREGVILASGDRSRIGQIHDGAILALQHGENVEVTQSLCDTLKGARPGINLVLSVEDRVLGVVGVTGDPDKIRVFSNLVKMTAEMMIEQAYVQEQTQWDRRHYEEFISSWLNETVKPETLKQWATRLGIQMSVPRVAIIIEFNSHNAPPTSAHIRYLVDFFQNASSENLVAAVSTYKVVVLRAVKKTKWNTDKETNKIEQQIKQLNNSGITGFKTVLGFYHPEICVSYYSALRLLDIGKKQHPQKMLYLYSDYRMPLLLSNLSENWQGAQLKQAFKTLTEVDKNGSLIKTLKALFENNGRISDCANALGIHRNTLRYRLERIGDITGLSPYKFADLFELYIGYLLLFES